jgi:hypothetical protein
MEAENPNPRIESEELIVSANDLPSEMEPDQSYASQRESNPAFNLAMKRTSSQPPADAVV